jgi:hypothetical protein
MTSFFNIGRIVAYNYSGMFYMTEYSPRELQERIKRFRDMAFRVDRSDGFAIDLAIEPYATEYWTLVIIDKNIRKKYYIRQYKPGNNEQAKIIFDKWAKAKKSTIARVVKKVKTELTEDV